MTVVALLGLSGGAFPHTAHAVLGAAWFPVGFYFAGWMVRDVGLWLGPTMAGRLRWLTVVGAAVQSLSAVAAVATVAVSGARSAGSEPFHAGTPAIAVSAVLALSIVAGLRVAWGSRGFEAARFSWPGVRRTSAGAG